MDHAVNVLREHVPENVRMHSVITHGGRAPNVVPEYARSWYYVRAKDRKQVDEVSARVLLCARAAAMATETRLKHTLLTGVYPRLPNDAFAEYADQCFRLMGPPRFDARDTRTARRLGIKGEFPDKVEPIRKDPYRGSTDEDNVSWLAPLICLQVACWPKDVATHHRDTTRLGKTGFAHRGMAHAGKLLALAAVGLMADPKALGSIRREFRKRTRDFAYDPLVSARQAPPVRTGRPQSPSAPQS